MIAQLIIPLAEYDYFITSRKCASTHRIRTALLGDLKREGPLGKVLLTTYIVTVFEN